MIFIDDLLSLPLRHLMIRRHFATSLRHAITIFRYAAGLRLMLFASFYAIIYTLCHIIFAAADFRCFRHTRACCCCCASRQRYMPPLRRYADCLRHAVADAICCYLCHCRCYLRLLIYDTAFDC